MIGKAWQLWWEMTKVILCGRPMDNVYITLHGISDKLVNVLETEISNRAELRIEDIRIEQRCEGFLILQARPVEVPWAHE